MSEKQLLAEENLNQLTHTSKHKKAVNLIGFAYIFALIGVAFFSYGLWYLTYITEEPADVLILYITGFLFILAATLISTPALGISPTSATVGNWACFFILFLISAVPTVILIKEYLLLN